MRNIASLEEISNLKTTDVYFLRAREVLKKIGFNPKVIMEITCSSRELPWITLSGLDDLTELLKGTKVDVYSLPEGTIFPSRDLNGIPIPAVKVMGKYLDFGMLETPIIGSLSQASGIATKASFFKKRIGKLPLLSFGVRRMHPALAPLIDRNSFLGGCDKVSSIIGAERIGRKAEGTMPHSLLLLLGEERGWKMYDEVIEKGATRIALVDTYSDEKESSLRAADLIRGLNAVRLDTPSSRRGNFADIVREVRWELDRRGKESVGIIVSGGIKEEDIESLKSAGASGFGIGTSISSAAAIDFAMDIVNIEGKDKTKKGKYSGNKNVFRCRKCHSYLVSTNLKEKCPHDGSKMESMYQKVVDGGKVTYKEDIEGSRDYVLEQLGWYELS
ncbi:MAG: nicotinate phosphoribosyltransferase [Thermoplasmatales archaeon]|nr:nicotinate phosphoribosyltransferase [Candidatus Thermoplasmatota archaeon]MCL6002113.1 nicotinate phosphoribosyltransferase [Candidatus Thermoplasmatota archaeon]MDA8055280.1 nicotinate phosphoribosyltransferase [Thermoplasmatales archaeon]